MTPPSRRAASKNGTGPTQTIPKVEFPPIAEPVEGGFNKSSEQPKVDPKMKPGVMAKKLTDIYATIGMFLQPFDQGCATVIIINAEQMANSLEALARENPAVKRVLERLLTTNAIMGVVAAHAPVVAAIAFHHIPALSNMKIPFFTPNEPATVHD